MTCSGRFRILIAMLALCQTASVAAEVRVVLRDEAVVSSNEILLGDIATITGSSEESIRRIRGLDVADFGDRNEELEIRRSLVEIRLRLDGWAPSEFRLTGPDVVTVRLEAPQPVTDAAIESAAQRMMCSLLQVPSADLRVRMASPLTASLPKSLQQDPGLRVEVLPPLRSRFGQVGLTVRIWRGPRLEATRTGRFEILRRQQVAVTRASLQRNHEITEDDIQLENRFLPAPADQLDLSQLVGERIRSPQRPGEILSMQDLQQTRDTRPEQLIRNRDRVRVTAVSGRLRVELTDAEALQTGTLGSVIRVRNGQSGNIISGRVVGPGEVEVRLR